MGRTCEGDHRKVGGIATVLEGYDNAGGIIISIVIMSSSTTSSSNGTSRIDTSGEGRLRK